ncbi:MAG: ribose transport system substrate-binding protein [Actinomycetota bacterium]|jgi:ribose transport system substrate-binding protein|nr:ribose transport system substrate-binding protein [Actinomycetota bacterium]
MKRSAPAVAVLALALTLTACGGSTGKSSGSASGSGSKVLGIVTITATDSNNAKVIKGAKAAAVAAGWSVKVVDAQGNADQANSAIRTFATQKVGMIFDLVFPVTSLGAGLAAARAAKIPVATWGGGSGDGVVMTTGNGAPFAEPSVEALLAAIGDSGKVLALTYRTGQVCRDREGILDKALASKPGIKVTKNEVNIPGFLQDGAKYANAWLAKNPKGSGKLAIWGCWEDPTLGAISALKQQKRTDVLTYGINGSSQAVKAVKDGDLTATVWEDGQKEGATMFTTTLEALKAGGSWTPKTVDVAGVLVSTDSVTQFLSEHPDAIS